MFSNVGGSCLTRFMSTSSAPAQDAPRGHASPAPTGPAGAGAGAPTVVRRLETTLASIESLERDIRAAQAEQLRHIAEAHRLMHAIESCPSRNRRDDEEFVRRAMVAEVATTLRVHERTASRLVFEADELDVAYSATRAALAAGTIGMAHVHDLVDTARSLPEPARPEFEAAALGKAAGMTPPAFRQAARRLRERMHPETPGERHGLARADRSIALEPDRDGMTWLHLYLEAERGAAVMAHVRRLALRAPEGDPRTRSQREVDCAVALLLGRGAREASEPMTDLGTARPTVYVTVPVLTLLGRGDEPGDLDGYGPIDPETARRLAAHAPSFRRILTHPETGAVLSYGRDTYRVPSDLAGYLRLRDGRCRFPACSRRAATCDIDHTRDWELGGDTSHRNLAHLCRNHHRLKHRTGWCMEQLPDGGIRWTSPSGRVYVSDPERLADPPSKSDLSPESGLSTKSGIPPEPCLEPNPRPKAGEPQAQAAA